MNRRFIHGCRCLLIALMAVAGPLRADPLADRKADVEQALDQYIAAKTEDDRTTVIDFLQHFDRKLVASALIDHIVSSQTGKEATAFAKLIEALNPDGCEALLDRLSIEQDAVAKGKLIVSLRHCQGTNVINALAGFLDDTRPVPFAAHTSHPRRVCDLAYDELFLKLRDDPRFGLDPSPQMKGVIMEKTPEKDRDMLIANLKASLEQASGASPSASAAPSAAAAESPSAPGTPSPSASPSASPAITGS